MKKTLRKLHQFLVNSTTPNDQVMMHCTTQINRNAVSRQDFDGVPHIVVTSATLPDDIVMNDALYPAEVIAESFTEFEDTLAPIEHPIDSDGNFIPAASPIAIHNFHGGAFNRNVRRENGRVYIDKFINIEEAGKTERGLHLLERIEELETNDNARPIHTSVALLAQVEDLKEPMVNAHGMKYTRIVRKMIPDHDAILLDSVGAAQPRQGVGMAVNKAGQEFVVNTFSINTDQSFDEKRTAIMDALEKSAFDVDWIDDAGIFKDRVIFWSGDQLFEVPYEIDAEGIATIKGIPFPVEREVTFVPKTNHKEGDAMKDFIVNALRVANVKTDGLSDEQLANEYAKLQAAQSNDNSASDDNGKDIAAIVANAVTEANKPLVERLDSIEENQIERDTTKLDSLAEIIGNSDQYEGIDIEAAKKLGVETLTNMASTLKQAFGVSPIINSGSVDESNSAPAEMAA